MQTFVKTTLLTFFVAVVSVLGIWVHLNRPYTAGSDFGYWLGFVGGVSMLLLLTYPLRKHLKALRAWGTVKPWFRIHMILGVFGPLCVIFHSGFHIGSVNAWVAMVCMLLVSGSGIIGRFVYVRIHHGLYGRQATLKEMEDQLAERDALIRRIMDLVPDIEPLLTQYRNSAFKKHTNFFAAASAFLALGSRGFSVRRKCRQHIAAAFVQRSVERQWDAEKSKQRHAQANDAVKEYVQSVLATAQFQGYEAIFRWWHILHIPLVYLLAFSAIYHVLAVHMY